MFHKVCECTAECWAPQPQHPRIMTLELMLPASYCAARARRSPFPTVPGELPCASAALSSQDQGAAPPVV
jgi:hypothetical protein